MMSFCNTKFLIFAYHIAAEFINIEQKMNISKVKKITPRFTTVITTMERYPKSSVITNGVIGLKNLEGTVMDYQKVIAIGNTVRDVKVGDIVHINPIRYAQFKNIPGSIKDGIQETNPVVKYNIPTIELDGVECLKLDAADIDYIVDEYE